MVTADYDSDGDSGQVGDPQFGSVAVPYVLVLATQTLFYELLEERYGDDWWETDEGSFGRFMWSVREDRINLVHSIREHTEEVSL